MSTETKRGRPAGKSRCECQCVAYLPMTELKRQLLDLVKTGRIGHFWAIEHPADEDASKPHIHLRMTPPPSRAVDWAKLSEGVSCMVPGESLPRKLVLGTKAVNDQALDGLLYARHDKRYCEAKNLAKATLDYPMSQFVTDDTDWLDGLWKASDEYDPPPTRMSVADVLAALDSAKGNLETRVLLRLCLKNGLTQGQFNMLCLYRAELKNEESRRLRALEDEKNREPNQTFLNLENT